MIYKDVIIKGGDDHPFIDSITSIPLTNTEKAKNGTLTSDNDFWGELPDPILGLKLYYPKKNV